jgi:hypothetical protein
MISHHEAALALAWRPDPSELEAVLLELRASARRLGVDAPDAGRGGAPRRSLPTHDRHSISLARRIIATRRART